MQEYEVRGSGVEEFVLALEVFDLVSFAARGKCFCDTKESLFSFFTFRKQRHHYIFVAASQMAFF